MVYSFYTKPSSFQPNRIYTCITQWITASFYIRGHIFTYQRTAGDERVGSNFYKLVNSTHTGKNCPLTNSNMASDLRIVAYDGIITQNTVVGKVRIGHYQAILTYNSLFSVGSSPVNSYKLPYGGIIANNHS